jgi:hypothetical protein
MVFLNPTIPPEVGLSAILCLTVSTFWGFQGVSLPIKRAPRRDCDFCRLKCIDAINNRRCRQRHRPHRPQLWRTCSGNACLGWNSMYVVEISWSERNEANNRDRVITAMPQLRRRFSAMTSITKVRRLPSPSKNTSRRVSSPTRSCTSRGMICCARICTARLIRHCSCRFNSTSRSLLVPMR